MFQVKIVERGHRIISGIKTVREFTGRSLVDAKKLLDNCPVQFEFPLEETAVKFAKQLEEDGFVVQMPLTGDSSFLKERGRALYRRAYADGLMNAVRVIGEAMEGDDLPSPETLMQALQESAEEIRSGNWDPPEWKSV